jgi:hypothetical protein
MKAPAIVLAILVTAGTVAGQAQQARPRVFVTDSQSWEVSGGLGAISPGAAGAVRGGARPQTAEIIRTVGERCGDAIVTMKQENADYILLLEREGGKGIARKDNKFALFNKDGDAIRSGSTRTLGNSVKDACKALREDWKTKAGS